MSAPKKPVNRKLLLVGFGGIVFAGILGILLILIKDPKAERQEKQAAEKAEKVDKQAGGTFEEGAEVVGSLDKALQRDQAMKDRLDRRKALETGGATAPAATPPGGFPDLDPEMLSKLEMFDQAQQSVMKGMDNRDASRTPVGQEAEPSGGVGIFGGIGSRNGSKNSGITEVDADRRSGNTGGSGSTEAGEGDLFGGGAGNANNAETYPTTKPKNAPSTRIVNEGVTIPAVLLAAFDTRNPGKIRAMVTRDVYDSRTHMHLLIPKGSSLVGELSGQVEPGAERVPGSFDRLVLTDGRAFDGLALQGSGLDGSPGVEGKYHSNLLRAIGPAFVVAVMGNFVDREFPDKTYTRDDGTTYEAPSVMQQVTPKLSEKVSERYAAAKQYWTGKPGDEIRITLTRDLEVPEGSSR